MTSLRALSLACVASLLAGTSAAASPVALARLEAPRAEASLAAWLDASLREEGRRIVGDRLLSVAPERPRGCTGDEACAAALAATHGATSVVLTSYEERGDKHELRVRLHDSKGKRLAVAQRSLSALPDGRVLRGALAEVLSPSTYVGRLRVEGLPSGARVKVDHLPLSGAEVLQPYVLSVGAHVVEVSAPGRPTLRREVNIAYDEVVPFDASLPASGEELAAGEVVAGASVPWWPAAVSAAVAGVAGTAAIIAAIDLASTTNGVVAADAAVQNGGGMDAHLYAAKRLPEEVSARQLSLLRAAIRTDLVILTVAGSIAVVAGAATGAFVTRWATAEEPVEEAP